MKRKGREREGGKCGGAGEHGECLGSDSLKTPPPRAGSKRDHARVRAGQSRAEQGKKSRPPHILDPIPEK